MIVYDIVAVHVAYFMALWSRFDFAFSHIPDQYYVPYRRFITAYSLVCVMVFWLFGLYKTMWRFASYTELVRTFTASGLMSVAHIVAITVFFARMPLTYYFFGAILQFILLVGARFSYRFYNQLRASLMSRKGNGGRVMVIGAGSAGQMIIRDIISLLSIEFVITFIYKMAIHMFLYVFFHID